MSATSPITRSSGAWAASAGPRTQPSRRTFCGSPERTTPAPRAWWRSSTARKETATSSRSTPPNFSAPSHRPLQTRPITARYCRPSAISTAKPVLTGRLQFTRDGWHWAIECDMRIHLGRRNIGVAEDGLDCPEVGAVFYHVRCATVAEHVRTGFAAGPWRCGANDLPYPLTR